MIIDKISSVNLYKVLYLAAVLTLARATPFSGSLNRGHWTGGLNLDLRDKGLKSRPVTSTASHSFTPHHQRKKRQTLFQNPKGTSPGAPAEDWSKKLSLSHKPAVSKESSRV
ncbi:hypothetical protein V8F33_000264 [Rhypophila sp. PSN 637]